MKLYHLLKTKIFPFLLLLLFLVMSIRSFAQPEQRYNRFQYHKYKWQAYHTRAFHVYFPVGYDSLCSYTVRLLPEATKRIRRNMITSLLKEPNIIIYPSIDQSYETNIGRLEEGQYTFPTFLSKGSRIVIAYNGSYDNLKEQLYESLVRSIWENQLEKGTREQAMGRSESIPFWYKEGSIRYFARKWPIEAEDALKLSFEQNNFSNWQQVTAYQPRLAGQAFCYFLNQHLYKQAVVHVYGQLKKKNLQRSLRLITKKPMDSLYTLCFQFYINRFTQLSQPTSTTDIKVDTTTIRHRKGTIRSVLISPSEENIAYTLSTYNKRTVYIYNKKTAITKRITAYDLPPWIGDHSTDKYPLIEWSPNGQQLIITLPVKGKLAIKQYSLTGTLLQKNMLRGVDGVNTIAALSKDNLLLSAFRMAQSDIITYDARKEKYTPVTADGYDDSSPSSQADKSKTYFTSTRPVKGIKTKDSLQWKQGIFSKDNTIKNIAWDTMPYTRWDKPIILPNGQLLATYTKTGTERFALFNNPANPQYSTHAPYRPYQLVHNNERIAFTGADNKKFTITTLDFQQWLNNTETENTTSPWLNDYINTALESAREDSIIKASKDDTPSFMDGILKAKPRNLRDRKKWIADSIENALPYNPKRIKPYVLQMYSAYFSARINNDYYINRYQPYLNYQGQFKFPEVGGMIQGGFSDLLENNHVNIAFRIPAGSEGSDFFFKYQNTAKKWDWGFTYFRKVESLKPSKNNWQDANGNLYPATAKVKTHYYELSASYPFTYDLSGSITTAVRDDRTIFLATDHYSLTYEDIKSLWSINSFTLHLDKRKPTVPFLYRGLETKAMLDVFKGLSGEEYVLAGTQLSFTYHQPLYKYITLVAKAQTGYSFGKNKVLYNLAGVDNNVTPRIDSNTQFSQDAPYAFQTLITPFRGYLQNTLTGNQYLLFNADVYFPLFHTLIPIETPLQVMNLLQPGIFADVGTAAETWNINSSERWLWSYGLSLRTKLASYPLRFDIAWPGTFSKKPVWYFSLSVK